MHYQTFNLCFCFCSTFNYNCLIIPKNFNNLLGKTSPLRCCLCFRSFVDLDECQFSDACGANHVCNNTVGSYRCECPIGFVGNSSVQDPLSPLCIGKKQSYFEETKYSFTIRGTRKQDFKPLRRNSAVIQDSSVLWCPKCVMNFNLSFIDTNAVSLLCMKQYNFSVFGD